mmetsp:Transcript_6272/g.10556  ORF Transcript_6272/g.10556 Transcript_6272/m.10556 type:complete len:98 (+) Transcript_6272:311-604(+)
MHIKTLLKAQLHAASTKLYCPAVRTEHISPPIHQHHDHDRRFPWNTTAEVDFQHRFLHSLKAAQLWQSLAYYVQHLLFSAMPGFRVRARKMARVAEI